MGRRFNTTQTAPQASPRSGCPRLRRFLTVVHPSCGRPVELRAHTIVGREAGPDRVQLDDPRVSRSHFELQHLPGEFDVFRLRDCGGKNGTLLDGYPSQGDYLHGSAVLRAGDSLLVFSELEPPPGDTPPSPELGRSVALTYVRHLASVAGPSELPVLIEGPTGAGKERLARLVHQTSGRPGPLVPVNCATFNHELLASELFGHVRGAFSGAEAHRAGLFQAAQRGTLFLDEIAELPLAQQPALLRALQEGLVRPVGADREVRVDVRVITATHQDLRALVEAGRFRADLYSRLAGVTLRLPGLSERREDILPLFRTFVGGNLALSADAAEALLLHDWPFSVRELQHTAAAVRLFAEAGRRIDLGFLPASIQRALRKGTPKACAPLGRAELAILLETHHGNVSHVARALGRSRQQIYRSLRGCGLDPAAFRPGGSPD